MYKIYVHVYIRIYIYLFIHVYTHIIWKTMIQSSGVRISALRKCRAPFFGVATLGSCLAENTDPEKMLDWTMPLCQAKEMSDLSFFFLESRWWLGWTILSQGWYFRRVFIFNRNQEAMQDSGPKRYGSTNMFQVQLRVFSTITGKSEGFRENCLWNPWS